MIPIAGPWIADTDVAAVASAVRDSWYTRAGQNVAQFESVFASYLELKHAVALPSCTAAIHLALVALDIGPGDEVILPDLTWVACCEPIIYMGATPVFADVDLDTWCISPESVKQCLTKRTKAVIAVDLYGAMPDYKALRSVCNGIPIIEDAAEALGSKRDGQPAGTFGDIATFSFHATKMITTGEGGMLVTNDAAIYERVMMLRDHGRKPGSFDSLELGYKYKMTDMQAALGLSQLRRIGEMIDDRRSSHAAYVYLLKDTPGITMNSQSEGVFNTYWMTTVLFNISNKIVMQYLAQHGIDTRPVFTPLSHQAPFKQYGGRRNLKAWYISNGINLPSHKTLSLGDISYVSQIFKEALVNLGREYNDTIHDDAAVFDNNG